ncbi:MAG: hypothetical protein J1G01_04350 [Clostridiales bacterium]|nr:hypothetical protein [Clostridiales bacterium]
MITEFDKSRIVAHYKREFKEQLANNNYENALDLLLKFHDETNDPDFHKACGMLYLLMSQDSDDNEFLTLAFREFMMYVREHPDCTEVYRDILATALLRRDPVSIIECAEWIRKRGQNVDAMMSEIAETGIDPYSGESEFLYLDDMFEAGEFGTIDPMYVAKTSDDGEDDGIHAEQEKRSKIIAFRGAPESHKRESVLPQNTENTTGHGNIAGRAHQSDGEPLSDDLSISRDSDSEDKNELSSDANVGDVIVEMLERFCDEFGLESNDLDVASVIQYALKGHNNTALLPPELRAGIALRNAEKHCEKGEFDEAIAELNKIDNDGGNVYYCAECVRAYIFTETNRLDEAEASLKNALRINPHGALAGTLMCNICEIENRYAEIPQILKNIDVADFIDADHVYSAMRMAMKYCETDDVLDLAEDYIDEYNILDIRQLYAQILYNSGDRENAVEELRLLSRIFYDDFNTQYYYLAAKSGMDALPEGEEVPQKVLIGMVDNVTKLASSEKLTDDVIDSDIFKYSLEVFLTLEYRQEKKILLLMFDALRKLAKEIKLEQRMRDALVSPYVEPLVKAVILSELLMRGDEFLLTISYRPISDDQVSTLGDGYSSGCYTAYAFVLILAEKSVKRLIETVKSIQPVLSCSEFYDRSDCDVNSALNVERDIAYYLIKTIKHSAGRGEFKGDDRLEYALGFASKAAANKAYSRIAAKLDGAVADVVAPETPEKRKHSKGETLNERQ